MTLRTFFLCFDGHQRRQEDDMLRRAWEVAHIISPWTKEAISPLRLLGRERRAPAFESAAEMHAWVRAQQSETEGE